MAAAEEIIMEAQRRFTLFPRLMKDKQKGTLNSPLLPRLALVKVYSVYSVVTARQGALLLTSVESAALLPTRSTGSKDT